MVRRLLKTIDYETHALRRIEQRGISKRQVEQAIADPLRRRPAKRPGAVRLTYQLNPAETLNVIIEELPQVIRVVTTWVST